MLEGSWEQVLKRHIERSTSKTKKPTQPDAPHPPQKKTPNPNLAQRKIQDFFRNFAELQYFPNSDSWENIWNVDSLPYLTNANSKRQIPNFIKTKSVSLET